MANRETAEDSGKEQDVPRDKDLLAQFHIAEYNAVMARLTNWVTLQNSQWAVLLIFLALIAHLHNTFPYPQLLAWGSGLVAECVCIFWYVMFQEACWSREYVEKTLRPKIAPLVHNRPFWNYEAYVAGKRGTGFVGREWMAAILALLAVGGVTLWRRQWWNQMDYLGLVLASIVFIVLLFLAIRTVRTRCRIFS
jgi:hypothetical protein